MFEVQKWLAIRLIFFEVPREGFEYGKCSVRKFSMAICGASFP